MRGKFVTFEGGEGAGKSTQVDRLAARLRSTGLLIKTTREPGGTPAAEAIRQAVLSGLAKPLGAETEAILFAAARADHVERLIRPALAAGEWVLCDRFADSTRVYQGAVGGVDAKFLETLERIAVGETKPDLTLILDLPPEIGMARVTGRLAGRDPDRFEAEALALHQRRRQAYLDIATKEPNRCVVIDATPSADVVAGQIWQGISERLLATAASYG